MYAPGGPVSTTWHSAVAATAIAATTGTEAHTENSDHPPSVTTAAKASAMAASCRARNR